MGNNNVLQLFGVEFKFKTSDIDINNSQKKTAISLGLNKYEANNKLVDIKLNKKNSTMGMVSLKIPPRNQHIGNPFKIMNDNIMNFTVEQNNTERWIYYNSDNEFFDNHPLHFHMTSGFYDPTYTSFINKNSINNADLDVISIKSGSHIAFKVKFDNFNSTMGEIPYLGYMFHCHYMDHHDMNMMGQFYVDP